LPQPHGLATAYGLARTGRMVCGRRPAHDDGWRF